MRLVRKKQQVEERKRRSCEGREVVRERESEKGGREEKEVRKKEREREGWRVESM